MSIFRHRLVTLFHASPLLIFAAIFAGLIMLSHCAIPCSNSCSSNSLHYPFHLQCNRFSNYTGLEEFELECWNGTLWFPLGSSHRHMVFSFGMGSLVIDPLLPICNVPNLKSFNITRYQQWAIYSSNYLELFNCTGPIPSQARNCSIPSPNLELDNCSLTRVSGCLSSSGYTKSLSGIDCSSFTSWVLQDDSNQSINAEYGLRLDWVLPGGCPGYCSSNAQCLESSSPLKGHTCRCKDGLIGDGYHNGLGCRELGCAGRRMCHISNDIAKVAAVAAGIVASATVFAALIIACALLKRNGFLSCFCSQRNMHQSAGLLWIDEGRSTTERFSYKELERATNCFSPNQKLGNGGCGTVYAGKLQDGRLVAVKRINYPNTQGLQQVVNEVNVLSTAKHRNLVLLLGCCIERVDPLIVFEYVPNGTLTEHLQRERGEGLNWSTRISIATETAEALAYLHSVDPPIYHRDVKSSNILLDYDFKAKVADFGLSRLAFGLIDASHISTIPQGTPGYLDPEYHQNFHLSDKSDVYSFGVVLIEIISGLKPIDFSRNKKEVNLAALAVAKIGSGCVDEIIDPFLEAHNMPEVRTMIQRVAELAFRCLSFDKDARPTMTEVMEELALIRGETTRSGQSLNLGSSSQSSRSMEDTPSGLSPSSRSMATSTDKIFSPTSVQTLWESKETSPAESLVETMQSS